MSSKKILPLPRRHRHRGSGGGSGSAAMGISGPNIQIFSNSPISYVSAFETRLFREKIAERQFFFL
jgi:hypothetical protein